jgi:C1A family cysteine protease
VAARNNRTAPAPRWVAGLSPFSHLTFQEFSVRLGGRDEEFKPPSNDTLGGPDPLPLTDSAPVVGGRRALLSAPTDFDWRDSGMVAPVRDQGDCGSCWAFAAMGAVESLYRIKRADNINLSEEQLVDCADAWNLYANL